jgi:hypothetical protein
MFELTSYTRPTRLRALVNLRFTTSNDIRVRTRAEPFGLCLEMMSVSFASLYYLYSLPVAVLYHLYAVLYSILTVDM